MGYVPRKGEQVLIRKGLSYLMGETSAVDSGAATVKVGIWGMSGEQRYVGTATDVSTASVYPVPEALRQAPAPGSYVIVRMTETGWASGVITDSRAAAATVEIFDPLMGGRFAGPIEFKIGKMGALVKEGDTER
jgi:hypothetical protein